MINITHKNTSLRKAIAQAIVKVSKEETIKAIKENSVPKGNVFEMAKTAGLFAAKRTSDMIPDCHPLPIEYTAIEYDIQGLEIRISVEVHTIYKTGVEVEAMHAASVVALTLYDMLKPIDKNIEIQKIKLIEKKGGKSDFKDTFYSSLKAGVIVCSDSIFAEKKEDRAGKIILNKLKERKIIIEDYLVIPDEITNIQEQLRKLCEKKVNMILLTGGTGLSKRDVTPEAVKPLLDKEIPGIAEAMRSYGQERTPLAMLSRSVVGLIGDTLVITLPGSTRGAEESMDAIFPFILHVFRVMEGARHD